MPWPCRKHHRHYRGCHLVGGTTTTRRVATSTTRRSGVGRKSLPPVQFLLLPPGSHITSTSKKSSSISPSQISPITPVPSSGLQISLKETEDLKELETPLNSPLSTSEVTYLNKVLQQLRVSSSSSTRNGITPAQLPSPQ